VNGIPPLYLATLVSLHLVTIALIAGMRAHRRAIVAHFVVRRKISRKAIFDFFDSIDPQQTFGLLSFRKGWFWRYPFFSMCRTDTVRI
jgi:hypothetical protein